MGDENDEVGEAVPDSPADLSGKADLDGLDPISAMISTTMTVSASKKGACFIEHYVAPTPASTTIPADIPDESITDCVAVLIIKMTNKTLSYDNINTLPTLCEAYEIIKVWRNENQHHRAVKFWL